MGQVNLTLEQEFAIKRFESKVEEMNAEETKEILLKLYKHFVIREATYKALIKQKWGICDELRDELLDEV